MTQKGGEEMFGAIYGDVIGSYYEVHYTKDVAFPLHPDSTFTDDSVLTAAVCKAILQNPAEISRFGLRKRAEEYAAQYRQFYSYFPNAGFGNLFSQWAKDPYARRGRSFGNGAAMRVIPIGYAYATLEQTLLQAKASCLAPTTIEKPSKAHKRLPLQCFWHAMARPKKPFVRICKSDSATISP